MPASYVFYGQPMVGTEQDDFVVGYFGTTGHTNNTINANGGDDWVLADSSSFYHLPETYQNGTLATAVSLDAAAQWTADENPLVGQSGTPHTMALVEGTIGQSEIFSVTIGAGETITIDIDYGDASVIGLNGNLVVELVSGDGNFLLASDDDSGVVEGGFGSFPVSPGSQDSRDPHLTYTASAAGTYLILVRPFSTANFTENTTFVMNVSVTGHAVGAATAMGTDTIDGGAGDDNLYGQGGDDILLGGLGNDLIHAGSGDDTVNGGDNDDVLYGGGGLGDVIHGDDGNDILWSGGSGSYFGDAGDDLVYAADGTPETLDGGIGIDTLDTTLWAFAYTINLATGATNYAGESFVNFEHLNSGEGSDTITGSTADNVIWGNGGDDVINGGGGDDTLFGGAGTDVLLGFAGDDTLWGGPDVANTLQGGIGNDNYLIQNAGDSVVEMAGEGTDTVGSYLSAYTLGANIENLTFWGVGAFTGTGNALGNVITGQNDDDVLRGRGGNDTLVGGAGTDTADYSLAAAAMKASLTANSASIDGDGGADTFVGIENLTGSAFNDLLVGSAGSNVLRGGLGADTLLGMAGNDVLWGGTGAGNQLQGGTGDDTYVLEVADSVVELLGEGNDTVDVRFAAYNLANNVENLIFGGVGSFTGSGNGLNNSLTGGAGDDLLRGRGGSDAINGGAGFDTADYSLAAAGVNARLDNNTASNDGDGGADTFNSIEALTGSAFNDLLISGAAGNTLSGGLGADTLLGFGGNDILAGGQGAANQLQGGTGNDTYIVDAQDSVVEFAGEGYDIIEAHVGALVMGANVEEMFYVGANKFYGTGNAINNIITAGVGNDILKGMGGNDTLYGGAGVDEVQMRGAAASYTITAEGAGYRIVDGVAGRDGSTYVDSIEQVRFLTGNTITVLTYPPPPSAPLEPAAKGADDAQVLPGLIDDEPLVLPSGFGKALSLDEGSPGRMFGGWGDHALNAGDLSELLLDMTPLQRPGDLDFWS